MYVEKLDDTIEVHIDNEEACDWSNMSGDTGFSAALYDAKLLETWAHDGFAEDILEEAGVEWDDVSDEKNPYVFSSSEGIFITIYLK